MMIIDKKNPCVLKCVYSYFESALIVLFIDNTHISKKFGKKQPLKVKKKPMFCFNYSQNSG